MKESLEILNKLEKDIASLSNQLEEKSRLYDELLQTIDWQEISPKDIIVRWKKILEFERAANTTGSTFYSMYLEFTKLPVVSDLKKKALFVAVASDENKYLEYRDSHPEVKEVKVSDKMLDILGAPTINCDFNTRTLNILRCYDIDLIYQLVSQTKRSFLKYRNFGKSSLKELEDFVVSHGLHFEFMMRYDEETQQYYTFE